MIRPRLRRSPIFILGILLMSFVCIWLVWNQPRQPDPAGNDRVTDDSAGRTDHSSDPTIETVLETPDAARPADQGSDRVAEREQPPTGRAQVLDMATHRHVEQFLHSGWKNALDAWEANCSQRGSGPDGEKTLSDSINDMRGLYFVKMHEAALDMLSNNEYSVFPPGAKSAEAAVVPRGHTPMRMYGVVDSSGQPFDLMFTIPDDHRLLKDLKEELKIMGRAQLRADVTLFNSLPEAERRTRIAAHRTALAGILAMRRDLTMPAEERQRRLVELSQNLLPAGWTICGDATVTTSNQ